MGWLRDDRAVVRPNPASIFYPALLTANAVTTAVQIGRRVMVVLCICMLSNASLGKEQEQHIKAGGRMRGQPTALSSTARVPICV